MRAGFRILSTRRGRYVVTPTGIVIGKHYRMPKPSPLPTVAANEAAGPSAWPTGGAFVVPLLALFVWAAAVALYLALGG